MKRLTAAVLAAVLLCPAARAAGSPPALSAASAILVDGESGRVLYEHNAREERPIASITKLMTCLLAAESGLPLDTPVEIQPEWTGAEGSSMYLRPGETVTLEALLYGLMLSSGNDAALAIAGVCGGDVDAFVERMNARAAELGMEQTHFANPNGLSDEGHYSTAYDMALLGRACLANETVAAIVSTKSITFGTRTFTNHNKLLWRYAGCVGMKTGYTRAAGRTLVCAAERDGQKFVAVTLGAPNDWADHAALFDYGFQTFHRQVLCTSERELRRVPVLESLVRFVPVRCAQDLYYAMTGDERARVEISLPTAVRAPVAEGDPLGRASFYVDGELVGETELLATASVHRELYEDRSLLERVLDHLRGRENNAWSPVMCQKFLLVSVRGGSF